MSDDASSRPSRSRSPTSRRGANEQREEDGFFERKGMSEAQKEKLRREYLGLGGGVNTAMGANYYLYIIVIISALAVAAKLSGAI